MNIWARCDDCGTQLDYQVGSIRWHCADNEHTCPSCSAERSVKAIMTEFRKSLRRLVRGARDSKLSAPPGDSPLSRQRVAE